ncbi:hypothetical protein B0H13DRAFT_2318734 [Mycena leptocephala]|nr:hypothetical protein B0H13DRAFT_2318734 [Mycena leptocephala]
MRFSSVFTVLATAAMVSAQQVKTVQVGGPAGVPIFTPNTIDAPVGTIVSFQFSGVPGNHSVTQSTGKSPCEPADGGFDSGWIFVNETLSTLPEWNITITNDTTPIWFYCKQIGKGPAPHCNLGMVGVINLGTKSFSSFVSAASAAPSVGQVGGGFVGIGASATGAPLIPSGAVYFGNPSAASTAPSSGGTDSAGTNTTGGGSSNKPPNSGLANGATSVGVLLAALFGMALVV